MGHDAEHDHNTAQGNDYDVVAIWEKFLGVGQGQKVRVAILSLGPVTGTWDGVIFSDQRVEGIRVRHDDGIVTYPWHAVLGVGPA